MFPPPLPTKVESVTVLVINYRASSLVLPRRKEAWLGSSGVISLAMSSPGQTTWAALERRPPRHQITEPKNNAVFYQKQSSLNTKCVVNNNSACAKSFPACFLSCTKNAHGQTGLNKPDSTNINMCSDQQITSPAILAKCVPVPFPFP